MLAAETHERRKLLDRARALLGGSSRHVDLAVELRAIDGDADPIRVGGRLDRVTRAFVGPPEKWPTWTVGVGQLPPLRFALGGSGRFVCVGAMGAGKTEVLARAAIVRAVLYGRNAALGVVAPTQKRLRIIWQKIERLLPPAWVIETRVADGEIVLINGCRLQFVAAKIYSRDIGSPIQGYSWGVGAIVDEEQDVENEALADVMMRGRDAREGRYAVLSTCTLKDTPDWRERKQKYEANPKTTLYRMEATANPFVDKRYWEELKHQLTERQYRMRVLALDARPERSVYPAFDRARHCMPRPRIGARDVTRHVTKFDYLLGYDPGSLHDVTLVLKAYQIHGDTLPTWWVIGELTTDATTTDEHVRALGQTLARQFDITSSDCIVVADPYGDRQDETRPDVSVYKRWTLHGYKIRPAAYAKGMRGAARPGCVPKEAGIEIVNTLLCNAANETRLYIDVDDRGAPVAPKLVAALEMSERDEAGKAETQKKGSADLSHWTAALRYSVYPWERVRLISKRWQSELTDGAT